MKNVRKACKQYYVQAHISQTDSSKKWRQAYLQALMFVWMIKEKKRKMKKRRRKRERRGRGQAVYVKQSIFTQNK